MTATTTVSPSSAGRVERFVARFIRSDHFAAFQSERDSDFWNEPERAARVSDAAEYGADGKTHAEVIQDWRDAFDGYLRDRRGWSDLPLFSDAVHAHFDRVEAYHEALGDLYDEIG